jgi:hypothetical protein
MAPDLSYYVGLHGWASAFCHTPLGVVTQACLPLSLLLLALLLAFFPPLTVLTEPHRALVRSHLQPSPHAAGRALAVAVLSCSARPPTCSGTRSACRPLGCRAAARVESAALHALDRQFHVTHLLQHLSTAVGVVALALVYRRALRGWPRHAQPAGCSAQAPADGVPGRRRRRRRPVRLRADARHAAGLCLASHRAHGGLEHQLLRHAVRHRQLGLVAPPRRRLTPRPRRTGFSR